MDSRLLCVLVSVLFSLTAFAQEIKGTVKDSTGKAVPYAGVNLRKKAGNAVVAYTTTDTKGMYALKLSSNPSADSFYLEARCMGYKTQSKPLTGLPAEIDFELAISVNELQSVIVKSSRPVLRTSGDTLSYKVSQFSTAQDRVIGDVIKRLPGIVVAEDGTIYYNNKPVSGVYIGGDNLLDDKYSIATNTIPQGVVNEVQVIDNHQPIKALQNKVASTDVAINLTFKNTAKLQLFGQESVGAGLPGNYNEDLNAMLFNDKYKALNYVKANNTGDDLQRDIFSHNSFGSQERTGNSPPATLLSLGSVNNPDLSRSRYLFNHSGILNLNNLVNFKNGLQLRLNAYYLHDKQQQDYSQQATIYLPGDTVNYTEIQHNRFNPSYLHTQLTLNENKDKYYLNNTLVMDDNRSVNYSNLNTNGSLVNQVLTGHPLSFSNELNMIRSSKSNNIIEVYSYISHFAEPENRTISPSYNAAVFNHGVPYTQLIQTVNVPTWFTNNYVSFKIPGHVVTQSFKTGFSVQSQVLASNLSLQQLNNTVNPAIDSTINHLAWTNKKLYAEAAYDIPGKKLKANLALPLTLQQINYSDTGYTLVKGLTRLYFNPQLNVKYQTGIEHFVTLQYSYYNEAGSIEDIYQGDILKDYRTLYANNADITLRQNQQAAAGFTYRRAIKLFFFNINASYNHTRANNIASSIVTNNLQQGIVLPYPNSADAWAANSSISKYSFALHTTFSGTVQWQQGHLVQIQNGALLPFNTTTEKLGLGAETKLNNGLNFSYRATGIQTCSRSAAAISVDHIYQLVQQAAIYYNPATNLQLKLSGDHYLTGRRGNADLKYFFADASVKYQIKKWNTDLQLDATNLLNVKTYHAFYLSANTLTASSYTLPGRIILLKVLFNLK